MDPGHHKRNLIRQNRGVPEHTEHSSIQPRPNFASQRHRHHRVQPRQAGERQREGQGEKIQPVWKKEVNSDLKTKQNKKMIQTTALLYYFSFSFQ